MTLIELLLLDTAELPFAVEGGNMELSLIGVVALGDSEEDDDDDEKEEAAAATPWVHGGCIPVVVNDALLL